jgi:hypothetical protein
MSQLLLRISHPIWNIDTLLIIANIFSKVSIPLALPNPYRPAARAILPISLFISSRSKLLIRKNGYFHPTHR